MVTSSARRPITRRKVNMNYAVYAGTERMGRRSTKDAARTLIKRLEKQGYKDLYITEEKHGFYK